MIRIADLEQSLGKLLCEYMLDFLTIYAIYIYKLLLSLRIFINYRTTFFIINLLSVIKNL